LLQAGAQRTLGDLTPATIAIRILGRRFLIAVFFLFLLPHSLHHLCAFSGPSLFLFHLSSPLRPLSLATPPNPMPHQRNLAGRRFLCPIPPPTGLLLDRRRPGLTAVVSMLFPFRTVVPSPPRLLTQETFPPDEPVERFTSTHSVELSIGRQRRAALLGEHKKGPISFRKCALSSLFLKTPLSGTTPPVPPLR